MESLVVDKLSKLVYHKGFHWFTINKKPSTFNALATLLIRKSKVVLPTAESRSTALVCDAQFNGDAFELRYSQVFSICSNPREWCILLFHQPSALPGKDAESMNYTKELDRISASEDSRQGHTRQ